MCGQFQLRLCVLRVSDRSCGTSGRLAARTVHRPPRTLPVQPLVRVGEKAPSRFVQATLMRVPAWTCTANDGSQAPSVRAYRHVLIKFLLDAPHGRHEMRIVLCLLVPSSRHYGANVAIRALRFCCATPVTGRHSPPGVQCLLRTPIRS